MDTYELKLCGVKRELPFIDLEDNLAFASFGIMGDTELITACAPELAEKIGDVDVIITAEAKGDCPGLRNQAGCSGKRNLLWQEKSIKSYMLRRGIGIGAFHHDLRGAASVPGRP